mmetsp:Transcript_10961/g.22822  ORF Transcript_10961/g.22822 Transcript_10961/m.22822 type:complete len:331 (+) Transcript_10961:2538-3530(+)
MVLKMAPRLALRLPRSCAPRRCEHGRASIAPRSAAKPKAKSPAAGVCAHLKALPESRRAFAVSRRRLRASADSRGAHAEASDGGGKERVDEIAQQVPWGAKTVVQVLVLWIAGFCWVGGVCVPVLFQWFGFNQQQGLMQQAIHWKQACFTVTVDVIEMCVGLGVLYACVGRYKPLRNGIFPTRLRGRWPLAVLLCCTVFPLVQYVASACAGVPVAIKSPLDLPRELLKLSPIEMSSQALFMFWTTCMSPIWEEVLFRGFLIPSLRRYVPTGAAVVASAVIFALLHFSMHRLLPLTLLGVLIGFCFTSTNNLLAPIALHSLWNIFAFLTAV